MSNLFWLSLELFVGGIVIALERRFKVPEWIQLVSVGGLGLTACATAWLITDPASRHIWSAMKDAMPFLAALPWMAIGIHFLNSLDKRIAQPSSELAVSPSKHTAKRTLESTAKETAALDARTEKWVNGVDAVIQRLEQRLRNTENRTSELEGTVERVNTLDGEFQAVAKAVGDLREEVRAALRKIDNRVNLLESARQASRQ